MAKIVFIGADVKYFHEPLHFNRGGQCIISHALSFLRYAQDGV